MEIYPCFVLYEWKVLLKKCTKTTFNLLIQVSLLQSLSRTIPKLINTHIDPGDLRNNLGTFPQCYYHLIWQVIKIFHMRPLCIHNNIKIFLFFTNKIIVCWSNVLLNVRNLNKNLNPLLKFGVTTDILGLCTKRLHRVCFWELDDVSE